MKTSQQKRAAFALESVESALNGLKEVAEKREFKSYASSLPAMVQSNGLGQAAAFFLMKGGRHKLLYDILGQWLHRQDNRGETDLMKRIVTAEMGSYMAAQAEAMLLLDWVKMFAKALTPSEKSEG